MPTRRYAERLWDSRNIESSFKVALRMQFSSAGSPWRFLDEDIISKLPKHKEDGKKWSKLTPVGLFELHRDECADHLYEVILMTTFEFGSRARFDTAVGKVLMWYEYERRVRGFDTCFQRNPRD